MSAVASIQGGYIAGGIGFGLTILVFYFVAWRTSTSSSYTCKICKSKKFSPGINVKVKKNKTKQNLMDDTQNIEYETKDGISKKIRRFIKRTTRTPQT